MKKLWTLLKVSLSSMLANTSGSRARRGRKISGAGTALLLAFVMLYISGVYSAMLMETLAPMGMEELGLIDDDAYARLHEGQNGKTEMWHVLEAEPGAFLYCGFDHEITREEFARRIHNNTLPEVLHRIPVKKGDTLFIPAGTIHAICRGIVVAEVQQSSNVTYRVYDYGRLGADGQPRALHIRQALDVTRLSPCPQNFDFGGHLGQCSCFTVDLLTAPQSTLCGADSFLSLLVLEGEGTVVCAGETVQVQKGESLFLPAASGEVRLTGTLHVLSTRV